MVNGADGWINSIHAIYQYTYLRLSQQAWEDYIQKEELAAVREAMQRLAPDPSQSGRGEDSTNQQNKSRPSIQGGVGSRPLSRSDIDRIKWSRRQQIALSDMEPPKVEPFEFFIIPDSTEAVVEPIAVGSYNPTTGQMEVATWEDVKQLIPKKED
jgi:hypothetical protein